MRTELIQIVQYNTISLRVFNLIAHEWDIALNTRREIPYLLHVLLGYSINIKALHWQEKSTQWMKKVVKCVGDKASDEKCVKSLRKQTMCVISIHKILSYERFPPRQKKSFQVHGQIRLGIYHLVVSFVLSREKCNYQIKATKYVTHGFSFRILVFFPL